MDTSTILYLVLALLVGAGFAWVLLRRDLADGTPPTADTVLTAVQDAFAVAQGLVASAEQLASTGQIAKDARFHYVFTRLRELFPNLSEDTLIAALEGAVWLVTKAEVLLEPPDIE